MLTENCCLGSQDGVLIPGCTRWGPLHVVLSQTWSAGDVHDNSVLTEGGERTKVTLARKMEVLQVVGLEDARGPF